jgi:carbonic anhydrase
VTWSAVEESTDKWIRDAKAIEYPRAALASDIATLCAIPDVPSSLLVSGLVYDTETGLIDVIVPLAPIRPEQQES